MIDLKFTVSEFGKITRTDLTPVISDSIGWYSATFTFHASWSEAKTALFKNGTVEAEAVLVNNTCVIPSTVLAERGDIRVSVYCGNRKTANVAKVQLTPSGYFEATPPAPPEPTQVAMYTFSDASGVRMFRYLDSKLEWYNGTVWTEVITDISGKLDKNFTAFTAETAITDTDQFPMNKTNGTLKKTAWSLIKSTLKTAHDLLYIPKLFNDLDSLTASELSGSAILPVNKSGLLNKISFNTLSSYLMEYSTHVSLTTVAQTIKGAINELVTSIGNKIAKTTNITAFSETGIADTGIPMYDVPNKTIKPSGKVLGDLALKGGTVVSDTTYNATYIAGTWTADESTDVLTCSGLHGLVVNRVVSFNALTGVLPTGISAEPEFYFVTSVPTTSTLTISLTRGGATLNITANGTTGWGIRRMDVIPSNTPLDFATYSEFDIYSDMGLCGSTTTANAYPLLSIIPNTTRITMNSASIYGATSEATMTGALSSKKYVKAPIFINIRKMATNLYFITCNVTGLYSDNIDMTSSTAMTSYLSGTITTADVTAILFASGYSTAVKNGTRVVVIGR
jgi:hypothetical protein